MTSADLKSFRDWFRAFCASYRLDNERDQRNLDLKEEHTGHVCDNIRTIARSESLSAEDVMLAETVALFHDIGRFPQYVKYKTFRDGISVNHGLLSAMTLSECGVLDLLPDRDKEIIIDSVKYHNAFSIADISDEDKILFLRLIRDADKLDIWRVFIEYYESPEEERPEAVGLGLPDLSDYNRELLDFAVRREILSLSRLKTLNDFKLLQLSWVFDLNFASSFELLLERHYIERIAATLPGTDEITETVGVVHSYARERCPNG